MVERVQEVEKVTRMLPAALEVAKAITAATTEVKKAAEDAIVSNAAAKPLNRFAVKRA